MSEPRENPGVVHEESDVNVRAILAFGGGLLVLGIVIQVLLALLFGYYSRQAAQGVRIFPLGAQHQEQLPPEPRLQTNPAEDLRQLRAHEDEVLEGYGWVDQGAGVAHIPIGEAMKVTIQRGLPVRPQTP